MTKTTDPTTLEMSHDHPHGLSTDRPIAEEPLVVDDDDNYRNNNNEDDNNNDNNNDGVVADKENTEGQGGKLLERINAMRALSGRIVNDSKVQMVIVAMIAVNAVMMGLATFDFVKSDPQVADIFELVDQIFLIVFTVELAMQLIYHGLSLFLDGWLVFDFVIIVVSWSFSSVQIIRAFRIFRALRLVTRIKVMKNLVLAVFGVMPRMGAIALLLLLIFYIFAVLFTVLFKVSQQTQKEKRFTCCVCLSLLSR